MSGIPAQNKYKSKFTGCKSIQPLRSVLGGSTFCSNDCYESLGRSLIALPTKMVRSLPILHVKITLVLSAKFDGDRRWTAIFKSRQKCSIGFKSGL